MTRDPSRGGIGNRLNTASNILINIPAPAIFSKIGIFILIARKATKSQPIAIIKFAPGPASATQIMPDLGDRRALKLIGTGLAQPKINPVDIINNAAGTRIVPTGSMCLTGLRVTLPIILAV